VIDDYFATYKGIRAYMDRIPEEARENGYVTSLFGRRRYFPGIRTGISPSAHVPNAKRLNMPIQNRKRHRQDSDDQRFQRVERSGLENSG